MQLGWNLRLKVSNFLVVTLCTLLFVDPLLIYCCRNRRLRSPPKSLALSTSSKDLSIYQKELLNSSVVEPEEEEHLEEDLRAFGRVHCLLQSAPSGFVSVY